MICRDILLKMVALFEVPWRVGSLFDSAKVETFLLHE